MTLKNKLKNKILAAALAAVVLATPVAALTGCGGVSSQAEAVATQQVSDMEGRDVEIPEQPERVACISSSAAHMMVMLGKEDRIVAVANGVKTEELMKEKIPELENLSVPMQDNDLNIEELMNIQADLVIVKRNQISTKGQMDKLDKAGIPYLVVDYQNMKELYESISLMGQVFGQEKKAEAYLEFMDDTVAMVKERLGDVRDSEKPVVYHSVNEAIRTDEQDGICQEIMELAGVKDVSADQELAREGNKTYATIEEIYNWNPDGIIANENSVTEYLLTDPKWAGMQAVKDGKVYTLPVGATRWCHPGSMEAHMGVLAVAYQFYPEEFDGFDLEKYVKDYYKEYFDLELDDNTVKNILRGVGMRRSNDAEKQ